MSLALKDRIVQLWSNSPASDLFPLRRSVDYMRLPAWYRHGREDTPADTEIVAIIDSSDPTFVYTWDRDTTAGSFLETRQYDSTVITVDLTQILADAEDVAFVPPQVVGTDTDVADVFPDLLSLIVLHELVHWGVSQDLNEHYVENGREHTHRWQPVLTELLEVEYDELSAKDGPIPEPSLEDING